MLVCRMTLVIKKWKRVKLEARNKCWKLRKNECFVVIHRVNISTD